MTRAGPWVQPSATALARWHRLHRDAVNLLAKPMNGGGELSRSAMAVNSDCYPSADREHWVLFGQWVMAARNYAHATPLERQTDAEVFRDLTGRAGVIMGLEPMPPLLKLDPSKPSPSTPRFRRDIDG